MPRHSTVLACLTCVVLLAGCALVPSPAVGDWSGKMTASPQGGMVGALATGMTAMMGGDPSAKLTLKSDGTGYLKVMAAPESTITWKADGDRILLSGMSDPATKTASPAPDEPIIGRLSDDKKTLTFDLGPVQFSLAKATK